MAGFCNEDVLASVNKIVMQEIESFVFASAFRRPRGEVASRQSSAKPRVDSSQFHQLGLPEGTGRPDGFC